MWTVVDWPVSSEKTRGPSPVVGAVAPRGSQRMRLAPAMPPVPPSGALEEAPDLLLQFLTEESRWDRGKGWVGECYRGLKTQQ